nr:MAG TPA: hypothetical protein [Caudoviricetes sp.]
MPNRRSGLFLLLKMPRKPANWDMLCLTAPVSRCIL